MTFHRPTLPSASVRSRLIPAIDGAAWTEVDEPSQLENYVWRIGNKGELLDMLRKPSPRDEALEELLIERDHNNVQISLLSASDKADEEELNALLDKRSELEKLIKVRQRALKGERGSRQRV